MTLRKGGCTTWIFACASMNFAFAAEMFSARK
jgi:hypothetical protein